jgi:hypothetical protein
MRKFAFAAPLLACLAGCTTSTPYGNFVQDSPAAFNQTMAGDAVKRLVAVYPPARTRFELRQATPDAFGTALVASLRNRGYALLEFRPDAQGKAAASGQASATNAATAAPSATTLALRYILDLDPGSKLYRVTLLVDTQSLTRAYLAQDGAVVPAGYWVRKE